MRCINCGLDLHHSRRILVLEELDIKTISIIAEWIAPVIMNSTDRLCHNCYRAAGCTVARMPHQNQILSRPEPEKQQQEDTVVVPALHLISDQELSSQPSSIHANVPNVPQENTPIILLPNYKRATGSPDNREDEPLSEKEIKVFCPKCKTEITHTAEGIQDDQTKILVAKVYHYFEQEYEELKTIYGDLDLTPLSKFRQRTALATGVSESTVLEILQEEEGRNAEKRQEPPEERCRARKRYRETNSSSEDDSSDDNVGNNEQSSNPQDAEMLVVKVESPESNNDEPEIYFPVTTVKAEVSEVEVNMEQGQTDPISLDVKTEPQADVVDKVTNADLCGVVRGRFNANTIATRCDAVYANSTRRGGCEVGASALQNPAFVMDARKLFLLENSFLKYEMLKNTDETLALTEHAGTKRKGRKISTKRDVTSTRTSDTLALTETAGTERKGRIVPRKREVTSARQHSQGESSTAGASSSVVLTEKLNKITRRRMSEDERKKRKRLCERMRKQRIQSDPVLREEHLKKDRERYASKKAAGLIIPRSQMTPRMRRILQKKNRISARAYYMSKKAKLSVERNEENLRNLVTQSNCNDAVKSPESPPNEGNRTVNQSDESLSTWIPCYDNNSSVLNPCPEVPRRSLQFGCPQSNRRDLRSNSRTLRIGAIATHSSHCSSTSSPQQNPPGSPQPTQISSLIGDEEIKAEEIEDEEGIR